MQIHSSHNNSKLATSKFQIKKPNHKFTKHYTMRYKNLQLEWMNEGRWKIEPGDFVNCNKIGLRYLRFWNLIWLQSSNHSQIPFSLMAHSHSCTIYGSPSMGLKHKFLKFVSLPKLKESQCELLVVTPTH
jgi:hypothetical protein